MTRIALALLLLAQQYGESITVARYVLLARVVDSRGDAVRDLTAADFRVSVDGRLAHVETAEWIDVQTQQPGTGRHIVFFMVSDFGRDASRLAGQMRFNAVADDIIELLGPGDRLAVVSHDSHLKLRADFTSDRAAIRKAIRSSVRMGRVPLPEPPATGASLARHFDESAMRNAASGEAAMLLVAEALRKIEGEKMLVVAGHGFGEVRGPRVHLRPEWHAAMALMQRERIPVLTIGTGLGGALMVGLAATARNSSGVFTFLGDFPSQSVQRVAGMVAGSYELVLRVDAPLKPGRYPIDVRVTRAGTEVHAPRFVFVEAAAEVLIDDEKENARVSARRLFTEAMRILQDGGSDGVEALLDAAIAADATLAEAWYERGMLAVERGDDAGARRDLTRYLELEPKGKHAAEAKEMLRTLTP